VSLTCTVTSLFNKKTNNMNKRLTNDQSKIDLVAKLVKEGSIDFVEAIKLLEVEIEKEYITIPFTGYPIYPNPLDPTWYTYPFKVTCDTTTVSDLKVSTFN
jgi:hypothetical protein